MNAQGNEPVKRIPELASAEVEALDSGQGDNGATKEAALFNKGLSAEEIGRLAQESEHRRSESFKDNFERVAICTLWIMAVIALAVGVTWFWHLLLPDTLHWLTADGVQKLQNIVTGGIIASLAANHMRKRLGH